jgi:hypothetical protein
LISCCVKYAIAFVVPCSFDLRRFPTPAQANYPPSRREMAGGRPETGVQVADHVGAARPERRRGRPAATCDRGWRSSRSFRYPLAAPCALPLVTETTTLRTATVIEQSALGRQRDPSSRLARPMHNNPSHFFFSRIITRVSKEAKRRLAKFLRAIRRRMSNASSARTRTAPNENVGGKNVRCRPGSYSVFPALRLGLASVDYRKRQSVQIADQDGGRNSRHWCV